MSCLRGRVFAAGGLVALAACLASPHAGVAQVKEADRFQALRQATERYVEQGTIPGAVILVSRNGNVEYLEAHGKKDPRAAQPPLQKDSLSYVASMTKPITAAAILMLMEQGKLQLSDAASKFVPQYKSMNVRVLKPGAEPDAKQNEAGIYDIVPAAREITIQHLITHTSGLLTIGIPNAASPPRLPTQTLEEYVSNLAKVPLDFQPGTKWAYSNVAGFDVLARIVEVVSKEPFDQYIKRHIFEPLGMKDSFLGKPPDTVASRVAPQIRRGKDGLEVAPEDTVSPGSTGTRYFSGAASLTTTAEDYSHFAEMLVNGGEWKGRRLLQEKSIRLMSTNQVGDLFSKSGYRPSKGGTGFGLGVMTVTDAALDGLSIPGGSFGWDGQGTHKFWVIPKEKMVVVMVIRANGGAVHGDLEKIIMHGVVK